MFIAQLNESIGDLFIGEERAITIEDVAVWRKTGKVPFLVFMHDCWETILVDADVYEVNRTRLKR